MTYNINCSILPGVIFLPEGVLLDDWDPRATGLLANGFLATGLGTGATLWVGSYPGGWSSYGSWMLSAVSFKYCCLILCQCLLKVSYLIWPNEFIWFSYTYFGEVSEETTLFSKMTLSYFAIGPSVCQRTILKGD